LSAIGYRFDDYVDEFGAVVEMHVTRQKNHLHRITINRLILTLTLPLTIDVIWSMSICTSTREPMNFEFHCLRNLSLRYMKISNMFYLTLICFLHLFVSYWYFAVACTHLYILSDVQLLLSLLSIIVIIMIHLLFIHYTNGKLSVSIKH